MTAGSCSPDLEGPGSDAGAFVLRGQDDRVPVDQQAQGTAQAVDHQVHLRLVGGDRYAAQYIGPDAQLPQRLLDAGRGLARAVIILAGYIILAG